MRYTLPIKRGNTDGFTLIEILIIAPIVVLLIGAFVGLMVSMVGDVLLTRDRTALTYDTQNALNRIEQDARLSNQFLTTSGTLPTPQGSNNNFTGTSAFVNATSVIFSELATDRNPADPGRMLVYYANQPNACGGSQQLNRVMLTKVIYFIKGGSLWRRTITPGFNTNTGTPDTNTACVAPWQKNSCSPGYSAAQCATNDEEIVKNLSSMTVYYFNNPGDTTATAASNALNASTISTSITTSKQVAGRSVTATASMRATKLNNIDTTVVPPAAPAVTHNFNTPNSVQFTWASVPTATTYQLSYKINSGTWTNQTLNATDTSLIVSGNRNDVVSFKVAAFNSGGGSAYATDSATMPTVTPLDTSAGGWDTYNSTYNAPGYTRTSSGRVFLRGLIKGGDATSGATIATLPPGYRPTGRLIFPAATSPNTPARVDVDSDGRVIIYSGNNTFTSLDNVSFMPDSSLLPSDQQYTWRELINDSSPVNGWENWVHDAPSPAYETVHAMIDNLGRVNMQGLARAGTQTANTAITNTNGTALTSAYFPPRTLHFQAGGSGFADFWIWYADGEVTKRGPQTSSYLGLSAQWYPGTKTGTTAWTNLPMIATSPAWVSYDTASYPAAQYTKGADGVVTVRGLIKNGNAASGTPIAQLPAGYRPGPTTDLIVVPSNDGYGRLDVGSDGKIIIRTASATWLALNFSFVADQ